MKTYSVHGLALGSEIPFPELPAADRAPDVTLSLGPTGARRPPGIHSESWWQGELDSTVIVWRDFGAVRVRGGSQILLDPNPGVDEPWVRGAVLGQILTLVLQQRGLFPLHASSVVIDGEAVALAGTSGAGKSTLCAALVERGHTFLSDDVTAMAVNGESARAHPGVPRQRLSAQALEALGLPADGFGPDPIDPSKQMRSMVDRGCTESVPLGAILVLEPVAESGTVELEPVPPPQAFRAVMGEMHRADLHLGALGTEELMRRCAALAGAVPVLRLRRPQGLEHLAETLECIEAHAR